MSGKFLKIGVTGSAGSGKSLICEGFRRIGLVTLDCDQIARQVVEPGEPAYERVVEIFGSRVVAADRTLDRAALRNIIVADAKQREFLESILHPVINREMIRQMDEAILVKKKSCAVEVPLLFELGMEILFDVTIVVTAAREVLVTRISTRDGVSPDSAAKMLDIQMPQSEKMQKADFIIENSGDPAAIFSSVNFLYQKLVKQRLTKG